MFCSQFNFLNVTEKVVNLNISFCINLFYVSYQREFAYADEQVERKKNAKNPIRNEAVIRTIGR